MKLALRTLVFGLIVKHSHALLTPSGAKYPTRYFPRTLSLSRHLQCYSTSSTLNARGKGKVRSMSRGVKKENLPEKVCVTCGRPFTWRKKWERCWDEVTTCSKSCNAARRRGETRGNTDADKQDRKDARRNKREGKVRGSNGWSETTAKGLHAFLHN